MLLSHCQESVGFLVFGFSFHLLEAFILSNSKIITHHLSKSKNKFLVFFRSKFLHLRQVSKMARIVLKHFAFFNFL